MEIKIAHKDKLDIVHKSKHKISVRTHFMARKPADV